ncbi:MAG: thioredoxin domain-containing protein [bacterium]
MMNHNPWFYVSMVLAGILLFIGGMVLQASFLILKPGRTPEATSKKPAGRENPTAGSDRALKTKIPGWIEDVPTHPRDKGLGNPDAPVTLTEYIDFQCPYCRRHYAQTFPRILKQYIRTGKIYYRIRHFPIAQMHSSAIPAAVASECAADQGKFWAFHHLAFANAKQLSKEVLLKLGKLAKIPDYGSFTECLNDSKTGEKVRQELKRGRNMGVRGTPATFVNGDTMISGAQPFSAFRRKIEAALKRTGPARASSSKTSFSRDLSPDKVSSADETVRFTLSTAREDLPPFRDRSRLIFRGEGGVMDGTRNPTLTVEKGQTVELRLINTQGGVHDLAVSGYRKKTRRLKDENTTDSLRFVANRTGEFSYFCSVDAHRSAGMEGTLLVKPAE